MARQTSSTNSNRSRRVRGDQDRNEDRYETRRQDLHPDEDFSFDYNEGDEPGYYETSRYGGRQGRNMEPERGQRYGEGGRGQMSRDRDEDYGYGSSRGGYSSQGGRYSDEGRMGARPYSDLREERMGSGRDRDWSSSSDYERDYNDRFSESDENRVDEFRRQPARRRGRGTGRW